MAVTFPDSQPYPMAVVIATLGGGTLSGTIVSINSGTIIPAEILICIPAQEAGRVHGLASKNVRVLITDCRGQVAQRAFGFRHATYDVVMQLDDDMKLEKRCIEFLLETLRSQGPDVAVGPAMMDVATSASTYRRPHGKSFIRPVYYWIMNGSDGYQPGKIDKSGCSIGVDTGALTGDLFDVEWLAGGCLMHNRSNLILESFYPFTGKAYYEDVIHSLLLRQKGVKLKLVTRARCWLESVPPWNCGHAAYLKYLVADFKARKYGMTLNSRSSKRIYLYYLASYVNYLHKKLLGREKK